MNLKDRYSIEFFDHFSNYASQHFSDFSKVEFLKKLLDEDWKRLELKDRMKSISTNMRQFCPNDYLKALKIWVKFFKHLQADRVEQYALEYMFINEFISKYGIDFPLESLDAMASITETTSCEFAIRSIILEHQDQAFKKIYSWIKHKNHHVRRLASEGTRPILPWSFPLRMVTANPELTFPILEALKNDESEYVRKSVANHLNDFSKNHPNLVVKKVGEWLGKSKEQNWVCKHGSRTLLKQGLPEILELFGFGDAAMFSLSNFTLKEKIIKLGDYLYFEFQIRNTQKEDLKLRLEYGIYYMKSNGKLNLKVFQISETVLPGQQKKNVVRKQLFKDLTTRKHYAGTHEICVIINGKITEKLSFELEK